MLRVPSSNVSSWRWLRFVAETGTSKTMYYIRSWKLICVYQKNARKTCNFKIIHEKYHRHTYLCTNNSLSGICSLMAQSCKGASMFSPSLLPLDWRQSAVLHMAGLFNRHCQYYICIQLPETAVLNVLKFYGICRQKQSNIPPSGNCSQHITILHWLTLV